MIDIPFYIAEEYMFGGRVYRGKFPIAIIENECEVSTFDPNVSILEELGEGDLSISGKVAMAQNNEGLFLLTQTDNNVKESLLQKSFILSNS